jgi:hypothetical protein
MNIIERLEILAKPVKAIAYASSLYILHIIVADWVHILS